MKNCIILGSKSDIAQQLQPLLKQDGWKVYGWYREMAFAKWDLIGKWDLAICTLGSVAPVGLWHEIGYEAWEFCINSNVLLPLRLLRYYWTDHNPGSSVCFFAGSNPNMIMDGYSAYNVGKMALLKAVEQLDHETPDAKFFALAPGIVDTKIHKATLEANWPNPKLAEALREGRSTPIQRIYDCLKWCISQPKKIIGGRNLCVSDPWDQGWLPEWLEANPNLYKLRRTELKLLKQ